MITIVENINDANCITHSGTMHADEVFATAFLNLYLDFFHKNVKLYRITQVNINDFSDDVLIYDVGRGEFDHHQLDREARENGIPYCSFGLLWKKFGRAFLKNRNISDIEDVFIGIDKDLVEGIDAIDNGIFPKVEADYKIRNLCDVIKLFNPSFGSLEEESTQFLKATEVAGKIFEEELLYIVGRVKARKIIEPLIPKAINTHYLILEKFMPYEEAIYLNDPNKDIYFVIYPSNRGGYAAHIIYNSSEERIARLPFPEEWAGLGSDLEKVSGVAGATFCHLGRFLVCANSKEAVIELVKKALNKSDN